MERPTNENTNGLLRQYFPKGTDLGVHTPGTCMPSRTAQQPPRKMLGWATPAQVFAAALASPDLRVATPIESALEPARRNGVRFRPPLTRLLSDPAVGQNEGIHARRP